MTPPDPFAHDAGAQRRGLLVMLLSAVSFAVMAFLAKLAAARLPAAEVAFFRFAFMLTPFLVAPRLIRQALSYQRLDLLVYRGVFGGTAVLLYFLAIGHLDVGLATLLNYTSPVFSVLFASLFLGERADLRLLPALIAAMCGLPLAAGFGGDRPVLGAWVAVGIVSAVLSGAAVAAIRAARRSESSWAIFGSFTLCGLVATAPFGLAGYVPPTRHEWLLLAAVGSSSVVAQLTMTHAYRWVTNLQAGVLYQLTVVLTIALGVVFLGDRLSATQMLGAALVVGGVLAVVRLQATPRAVE